MVISRMGWGAARLSFPNKNLVESIAGSMPLMDFAASSLARLPFCPNMKSVDILAVGTEATAAEEVMAGTRAGAAVDKPGIYTGFSAAGAVVVIFLDTRSFASASSLFASPIVLVRFFLPPEGRSEAGGLVPNIFRVASAVFQFPAPGAASLEIGVGVASWTVKNDLFVVPADGMIEGLVLGVSVVAVLTVPFPNGVIVLVDCCGVVSSIVADSMPPRDAPGGGGAVASRVYIRASTGDTRSFDFRIFSSIESKVSRMRLAVSVVAFGEGDGAAARPLAAGVAPAFAK